MTLTELKGSSTKLKGTNLRRDRKRDDISQGSEGDKGTGGRVTTVSRLYYKYM